MMIVDIHTHFDRNEEARKKIVEAARNAGINKLVLLPSSKESPWPQYSYTSEEVKKIEEKYPEVVGFCAGSLTNPEGIEILEESVMKFGMRGMKVVPEMNMNYRGLLACHALFRRAGQLKIPVLVHPSTPIVDAEIARICPDTTFIFAHVGYHWEEAFQAAKPHENACFDTSGYDCVAGVVERGVELLGPERIFFGSDVPVRNFPAQMAKVQYADISKKDKRLILGDNAAGILKLR